MRDQPTSSRALMWFNMDVKGYSLTRGALIQQANRHDVAALDTLLEPRQARAPWLRHAETGDLAVVDNVKWYFRSDAFKVEINSVVLIN
jgi:hypothetical protein